MVNSKTSYVSTGLLPDLYKRLLDTLVVHPHFESNEKLRAAFIDARIHLWRNTVPQADNVDTRVRRTIDYLYERHNTEGKNALVLCLQVLGECVDPDDALCSELLTLADEVEAYLKTGQAKHILSPPITKSSTGQKLTPIPTNVTSDVTCKVDMVGLRAELERYDAVQIESLCLDHFSQVYDKLGRGLRHDEMTNLLLDYVRRRPEEAGRLSKLLVQDVPQQQFSIPETILIPASKFSMGSEPNDPLAFSNETPRQVLTLPDYAIGKYPVTNAEYLDFVQVNPRYTPSHWINDQIPAGKENHPVVNVSYQDALAYCQWLSQQTKKQYRLPTEEEWEKAARGARPETRRYPWGDDWNQACVNTRSAGYSDTTPVNAFEDKNISYYKVIDMVGNVWEWTSTPYAKDRNVVRGGSWRYDNRFARNSCRGRCSHNTRDPDLGFRIVKTLGG